MKKAPQAARITPPSPATRSSLACLLRQAERRRQEMTPEIKSEIKKRILRQKPNRKQARERQERQQRNQNTLRLAETLPR